MIAPDLQARFPELFHPVCWGAVEARFELGPPFPPLPLVSNVNIIPFVGDRAVVLRLADGRPEPPGGTREPGEGYWAALCREVQEEAGAQIRSYVPIGAWHCLSAAAEPYRAHLPHPRFYRLVGYGDIEATGPPTNPVGGEEVVAVDLLPISVAACLFEAWQRPDVAALYRLSAELRNP